MSDVSMARMFDKHPVFAWLVFMPLMFLSEHARWLLYVIAWALAVLPFAVTAALTWYVYPNVVVAVLACLMLVFIIATAICYWFYRAMRNERDDLKSQLYNARLREYENRVPLEKWNLDEVLHPPESPPFVPATED